MGTRADFYIGRGEKSEWVGSTGHDGYPDRIPEEVLYAGTVEEFRAAVIEFAEGNGSFTKPEQGWPWPWDTSRTTDYAYAFDEGRTWVSNYGSDWFIHGQEGLLTKAAVFPDMSAKKNVTWGKRSGLLIFGLKK